MEALLGHVTKFVSNNISIHLYSYPHFSVELVLAVVLCVAHLLLIFETDKVFEITNAKALAKLRGKQTPMLKEIGPDLAGDNVSYHTISRMQTQVFPQKIETTRQSYYVPFTRKVARKISTRSNVGWLVPRRRSSLLKNPHLDRVEHLLSLSPSEYIRQDRQRKEREAGLKSCIHSLTSLLEKALSNESDLENESKEAIRRSIKNIRANLQYQIGDDYKYINLLNPSLNTLVKNCFHRKPIKHSSVQNSAKGDGGSEFEDVSNVGSQDTIDVATSDYSDYYVDRSFEVIHGDRKLRV